MEYIDKIKWYHIVIVCLLVLIVYLVMINMKKSECFDDHYFHLDHENHRNENKLIKNDVKPELILYYATWCGHSRTFLPEWEKLKRIVKSRAPYITLNDVRCEDGDEETCIQKGIKGYPTIILYLVDGTEKRYEDQRTADKLLEFIENNVKH